jgi:hypothetical protein
MFNNGTYGPIVDQLPERRFSPDQRGSALTSGKKRCLIPALY